MEGYQTDILLDKDEHDRELASFKSLTLEGLLDLYEEGGVNFVINDGRIVDYEIE